MQNKDKQDLDEIEDELQQLKDQIPDLNKLICDGRGDPCHDICGGAGCKTCGESISCSEGAKQKVETALRLADETETILRDKEALANDFIRNISNINTTQAKILAQEAYDKALEAYNLANSSFNATKSVTERIEEFLNENRTSSQIRKIAEKVLETDIKATPEEVSELATKIRKAVQSLTNIDPIIAETKDDLDRVKKLKDDANTAK